MKTLLMRLGQIGFLPVMALLVSCATTPDFDTSGVNTDLTPNMVASRDESGQGTSVMWGGVIIAAENLEETTRFEILSYPLDSNQRPNLNAPPQGRFLAVEEGYVETADYNQGRLMTIVGVLQEPRAGRIGETEYIYPVLQIDRKFLWPRQQTGGTQTRFQFGLGVIFSN